MTERSPDLPPAGWYPDPAGAAALRWWNGVTWSDTTHPQPGYEVPPENPVSPPEAPVASPWSSPSPLPAYTTPVPAAPTQRRRTWVVATALVVVLALVVGLVLWLPQALSGRHELDTDAVAAQVSDTLSRGTGTQVDVSCPSGIPLEAGSTFTCTATAPDGSSQDILVTQTNDQGDVTWSPTR